MPRIRRTITIEEKIAQAEENVLKCKEKYDAAVAELAELREKKDAMKKKELFAAIETSAKTYDEILAFLTQN